MSKLLRLDGLGVAAPGEEKAPKWNQLFVPGTFHRADFPDGAITFDGAFFARIVENWKREGARPLPVDYFHRGETGDDLPLEEKLAAGWISDLQVRPDGVWGLIGWTERARGHILADELRYLSPTFSTDGLDRSTGQSQGPTLFGAALLNDPFLKELPRVAASASPPSTPNPPHQEKQMDPTQQLAALMAALGLPPDMKHEDAVAKCTAMAQHCASMPPPGTPAANGVTAPVGAANAVPNPNLEQGTSHDAGLPNADNAKSDPMIPMSRDGVKALELANKKVVELAERVKQLEADKFDAAVIALSDKLLADRRITPAQRAEVGTYAKAVGLSAAESFFSKLPQHQLGEVGTSGKDKPSNSSELKDEYFAEVARVQEKHKLSFKDACARVNSTKPELAKSAHSIKA